jgi:cardiolipin synthase
MVVTKQKRQSYPFRLLEKRLRGPMALIFLALWTVINFVLLGPERPLLPNPSTPICLYSNQAGDDIKLTLKEALNSATDSIYIAIYSLNDRDIIALLRKKAQSGIKVFIVHDPVATQDMYHNLGPNITLIGRRHKGLMHNKLIVIDQKMAYLGSANLTRDSLVLHANLVVGIESEEVAKKIANKIQDLAVRTLKKSPPVFFKTATEQAELYFLPESGNVALARLQKAIQSATKSLKVAMFTFTLASLADALIAARERGIEVEVVLDADSAKQTSAKILHKLQRAHVAVSTSNRLGLLHHKMLIIDDAILVTGSANWTKAAFYANDENLFFLFDLLPEQKEKLALLWHNTLQEALPTQE